MDSEIFGETLTGGSEGKRLRRNLPFSAAEMGIGSQSNDGQSLLLPSAHFCHLSDEALTLNLALIAAFVAVDALGIAGAYVALAIAASTAEIVASFVLFASCVVVVSVSCPLAMH